jgi:hypothetical protein
MIEALALIYIDFEILTHSFAVAERTFCRRTAMRYLGRGSQRCKELSLVHCTKGTMLTLQSLPILPRIGTMEMVMEAWEKRRRIKHLSQHPRRPRCSSGFSGSRETNAAQTVEHMILSGLHLILELLCV